MQEYDVQYVIHKSATYATYGDQQPTNETTNKPLNCEVIGSTECIDQLQQ